MKVYLDTNLVSSIVRDDLKAESDALTRLLELHAAGKISCVTSKVTLDEIDRCNGPHKIQMQRIYHLLEKVPYVEANQLVGVDSHWDERGGYSNPIFEDDPIWLKLCQCGLSPVDAHHVMVAVYNGCNTFLTCDTRSILKRRTDIEEEFQIDLLQPSELLGRVGNP